MRKKILITGGAGFIGSNLSLILLNKGYFVRVLDNLDHKVHGSDLSKSYTYNLIKDKVHFIKGSILSEADVNNALINIDILIHLAAETGTGQSMYDVTLHTNTNINGIANIYEQIIKRKIKLDKIIIASSRSVYGEGKYFCQNDGYKYPKERDIHQIANNDYEFYCDKCGSLLQPCATDEKSPANLKSVYAYTKHSQEQIATLMSVNLKIPTIILRLQNVYGVGQSLSNPYTGIVSIFSNLIRNKSQINVFEDGKESRDFIYVDDVSKLITKFLELNTNECEIYNIGSGVRSSVLDIIEIISKLMNVKPIYKITGEYRLGDIRHNFADLDKLKNRIEYNPLIKLEEGINNLLSWIDTQDHQSLNDKYIYSINSLKKFNLYK